MSVEQRRLFETQPSLALPTTRERLLAHVNVAHARVRLTQAQLEKAPPDRRPLLRDRLQAQLAHERLCAADLARYDAVPHAS